MKHVLECNEPLSYKCFKDIRFDPSVVPERHTVCVCLKIFEEMGLLKTFLVKREKIAR